MRRSYFVPALAAALFAMACDTPTVPDPVATTPNLSQIVPAQALAPTEFQDRIARVMAARAARGGPTPAVTFEFESEQGSSVAQIRAKRYRPGSGFAYTARTMIQYRSPAEAGLQRWPEMRLSPEMERRLGITSAQLRARYIAAREASSPGFWQRYELGLEPRTYRIIETEMRRYARAGLRNQDGSGAQAEGDNASTTLTSASGMANILDVSGNEFVFGFSLGLPALVKNVTVEIPEVESLTLSFTADADAGLRLPMSGTLSADEPVNEGTTFAAASAFTGLDWSGGQYADVGLEAEDGHEAFFKFIIQGCIDLNGIIDEDKQCAGPNEYHFKDFTTPLGAGNLLALPEVNVPVVDYGVAGVDFVVNSGVGSDRVDADWTVGAEGLGGGSLSYANAGTPVTLADVLAVDGPGQAAFTVSNFKYHVNQFSITPGVRLWVDISIPIPLAPDIEWSDSWTFNILTIDLDDLLPIPDLGIPLHGGSYTGATSMSLGVEILNVAPTASMTLAGGTTMIINGVETVVGNVGDNFTFTGTSFDPGRDGLTLSWDWGDGAPAPDVSTLYPVGGPTGPNNAADVKSHAFTQSCMYDVTFKSVDDDAAFATDQASILVTESGNFGRLEGYWQKQYGQIGGSLVEPARLNCYLRIIERVSAVFNEARSAATLAEAFAVLNLPNNGGSEIEQLDRELMVAWTNFAAGAVQYQEAVDTNGDGIDDTPFNVVMAAAEAVRLNPASTLTALREQTVLVHKVSEQLLKP